MEDALKLAAKRAAVMLAFSEGKKIEETYPEDPSDTWRISDLPTWNWDVCDYRVAPEPVELPELWAVFDGDQWLDTRSSKPTADEAALYRQETGCRNARVVRYVPAPEEAPADKLNP